MGWRGGIIGEWRETWGERQRTKMPRHQDAKEEPNNKTPKRTNKEKIQSLLRRVWILLLDAYLASWCLGILDLSLESCSKSTDKAPPYP